MLAVRTARGELSRARRNPISDYPLTGRIRGVCGRAYVGCLRSKEMLRTYRCSGVQGKDSCGCVFLPADVVETAVWRLLDQLLLELPDGHPAMLPGVRVTGSSARLSADRVKRLQLVVSQYERALDSLAALGPGDAAQLIVSTTSPRLEADVACLRDIETEASAWLAELEGVSPGMNPAGQPLSSDMLSLREMPPEQRRALVASANVCVRLVDPAFRYREGTRCRTMLWHLRTGTLVPPDPSDAQWQQVESLLRERHGNHHFRTPLDLRAAFLGMLHRLRTGSMWRELPERFGPYGKVRLRQITWLKAGTWEAIMEVLGAASKGTPAQAWPVLPPFTVHVGFPGAIGGRRGRDTWEGCA
ncbi:transposase [Streptomyces mesophilus]|uniref:transposase n=1 Tax=Streptomyces mesophilus TaxID=1775132 RepID=UPI0033321C62